MSALETGINLYGMMRCGKTTVGKLIAARFDVPFIDTDDLIEKDYGSKPGEIVSSEGPDRFMAIQREIILAHGRSAVEVWATGGAVAGDAELVRHLGSFGVGAFIYVEAYILEARTPVADRAKLANPKGLNYRDLYLVDRKPNYLAAADLTVQVYNPLETAEQTADRVVSSVLAFSVAR